MDVKADIRAEIEFYANLRFSHGKSSLEKNRICSFQESWLSVSKFRTFSSFLKFCTDPWVSTFIPCFFSEGALSLYDVHCDFCFTRGRWTHVYFGLFTRKAWAMENILKCAETEF